jgi:hypothetical protein
MSESGTSAKSTGLSAPMATLLVGGFSLVSAMAGAVISGGYRGTIEIERFTLQKDLVLRAIDRDNPHDVRNTLEFLAKTGLLKDYETKILAYLAATPDSKLPTGARFGRLDANEYSQKVSLLRPVLDLIGDGETHGNYNAYAGHGDNLDSPRLTGMTVNAILEWQKSYLASGHPSAIVGKYGLTRNSIQGAVTTLALSGDELFDSSAQDIIAVWFMERRGLNEFLSGALSAEDFGTNLAKEWASLPVLKDLDGGRIKVGQSFYAGNGLNKALISADRLLLALNSMKPVPVAAVPPPSP